MKLPLIILASTAVALSGCTSQSEEQKKGVGDAPVGSQDRTPPEILVMPDQYPNIATKCDGHGHRVYVVTHNTTDVSPVVITDPTCPGGAGG